MPADQENSQDDYEAELAELSEKAQHMLGAGPTADALPDSFEVDSLLPPSQEAIDRLNKMLEKLDTMGDSHYAKSVEIYSPSSETDSTLEIYCSQDTRIDGSGKVRHSSNSVTAGAQVNGKRLSKSDLALPMTDAEKEALDRVAATAGADLDEKGRTWLLKAYQKAGQPKGPETSATVEELLETSPFSIALSASHFVDRKFKNGSEVRGHSITGNEDVMEEWPDSEATRAADLKTADGTRYDYSAYKDGRTRLRIKRPGETVPREVSNSQGIEADLGNGVSIGMRGTPEVMRSIHEAMEEDREVRRLGLDQPTEGNVREFTGALEQALASGTADK